MRKKKATKSSNILPILAEIPISTIKSVENCALTFPKNNVRCQESEEMPWKLLKNTQNW